MLPPVPPEAVDPLRGFRRLAWISTGLLFLAIVIGAVVRITGSGLGCGDDWPRCNGQWLPPMTFETFVEYFHRLKGVIVTVPVTLVAALAWRRRSQPGYEKVLLPALLAVGFLISQILLGALTVILELPSFATVAHLGNAMGLLAAAIAVAVRSAPGGGAGHGEARFARLAGVTAGFALLVILLGGLVANTRVAGDNPASPAPSAAAWACQGFPLCNGELLPAAVVQGNHFVALHWTHRTLAYLLVLHMVGFFLAARRRSSGAARRWAYAAVALTGLQLLLAAHMVLAGLPDVIRGAHMALGTAIWGALVATALLAAPRQAPAAERRMTTATERASAVAVSMGGGSRRLLRDYVTLTKPRIISLLLLTTLAPMILAVGGWPGTGLIFFTLLGGYLMAGGANAINMYLDRDIDALMGRTALRPIPSGRLSPRHGLVFGLVLAAAAFSVLALLVNLLAAGLALTGLVYYVLVYTRWLKRSSPQNIVIGGAAGAFPPLVGWAAATGEITVTAVALFLIVFFWTPPHFWALALVKQKDYGRVGIPMAPNVWGERETMRRMVIYTAILLPLTLVPVIYGGLGAFYGVAAVALGSWFLYGLLRLLRASNLVEPAWSLYRSSLLYLALLFVAMAVDGVLVAALR